MARPPSNPDGVGATNYLRADGDDGKWQRRECRVMHLGQLRISRRSMTIAIAVAGVLSLVIGAHAALNMRPLDAAKAVATTQDSGLARPAARLALVIGYGHYPDAD